jgi:hypothetical protein
MQGPERFTEVAPMMTGTSQPAVKTGFQSPARIAAAVTLPATMSAAAHAVTLIQFGRTRMASPFACRVKLACHDKDA